MKLVDSDGFEYDEDLFESARIQREYDEYWDASAKAAIQFLDEMCKK